MQQNSHPGSLTRQLLQRRVKPSHWLWAFEAIGGDRSPVSASRAINVACYSIVSCLYALTTVRYEQVEVVPALNQITLQTEPLCSEHLAN